MSTFLKAISLHKYIAQNPRDAQMADNLIYLSKKYPDKKIIVWGASYHFANNIGAIDLKNKTTNTYLI